MTKFYGDIGFVETTETSPGIWEPVVTTRKYFGDVNRNQRRYQENAHSINDNLNISNEISILADDYALENYGSMRWVEFRGVKWKITWINLEYPRIVLTLSGVYNENEEVIDDEQTGSTTEPAD